MVALARAEDLGRLKSERPSANARPDVAADRPLWVGTASSRVGEAVVGMVRLDSLDPERSCTSYCRRSGQRRWARRTTA